MDTVEYHLYSKFWTDSPKFNSVDPDQMSHYTHLPHKLWTKICEIRQNTKGDLTKFCEIFLKGKYKGFNSTKYLRALQ